MGMCREIDRVALQNLQNGESCNVFWSEDGGGVVLRLLDEYTLYHAPRYGVRDAYHVGSFSIDQIDELLDMAYSWT